MWGFTKDQEYDLLEQIWMTISNSIAKSDVV